MEISIEILEIMEPVLEVFVFAITLSVLLIVFSVRGLIKSELKKPWKYYIIAVFLFGIHNLIAILKEFKILEVSGFYTISEISFATALLAATYAIIEKFKTHNTVKKL